MKPATLPEWLEWLERQHHSTQIELGLERINQVASQLTLSDPGAKVITVAGTNGKGSFVEAMQTLLTSIGKKVASYTSPHFLRFNERIKVNGNEVTDAELVESFEVISKLKGSDKLTYFEFTTLVALQVFKTHELDYIILEVGLGGRLDAVNIIEPDLAVLTSIGLDHQDYLGETLEEIAIEKLGILRPQTPLITVVKDPVKPILDAIEGRAHFALDKQFHIDEVDGKIILKTKKPLPELSVNFSMNGLSPYSVCASIIACLYLEPEASGQIDFESVTADLSLTGRFSQYELDGVQVILDVAHNPQAANLLHRRLAVYPLQEGAKRYAIFGSMKDKDVHGVVSELANDFAAWFLADLQTDRAFKAAELADIVATTGCRMISVNKNVRQAFARVKSLCKPGDQIVAFGSFYVVSELLVKIRNE